MNIFIILLRIVHIFAGVLWVGSAIFYFVFVEPTVKGLGRLDQSSCRILLNAGTIPST